MKVVPTNVSNLDYGHLDLNIRPREQPCSLQSNDQRLYVREQAPVSTGEYHFAFGTGYPAPRQRTNISLPSISLVSPPVQNASFSNTVIASAHHGVPHGQCNPTPNTIHQNSSNGGWNHGSHIKSQYEIIGNGYKNELVVPQKSTNGHTFYETACDPGIIVGTQCTYSVPGITSRPNQSEIKRPKEMKHDFQTMELQKANTWIGLNPKEHSKKRSIGMEYDGLADPKQCGRHPAALWARSTWNSSFPISNDCSNDGTRIIRSDLHGNHRCTDVPQNTNNPHTTTMTNEEIRRFQMFSNNTSNEFSLSSNNAVSNKTQRKEDTKAGRNSDLVLGSSIVSRERASIKRDAIEILQELGEMPMKGAPPSPMKSKNAKKNANKSRRKENAECTGIKKDHTMNSYSHDKKPMEDLTIPDTGARSSLEDHGLAKSLCDQGVQLNYDPVAAESWIYPAKVPERKYQIAAINAAFLQNTLICLPTGLGKTLIAAVIMYNFSRWFPKGKIVFVAPTRPLVAQQIQACQEAMGMAGKACLELTGRTKIDTRKECWHAKETRVYFCTPQTFSNDVKRGICPYEDITCIVVDECHRAVGQADIVQTLRFLRKEKRLKFRVVGLSATPGSNTEQVQEVINNLSIGSVFYRDEEDDDVRPYVHQKSIEICLVPADPESLTLRTSLMQSLQQILGHLCGHGLYYGSADAERVTRYALFTAQKGLGPGANFLHREWFRQAMILSDIRDQLENHGCYATLTYTKSKLHEEKCIKNLHSRDPVFAHFVMCLRNTCKQGGEGPRMRKLIEILCMHFQREFDRNGEKIVRKETEQSIGRVMVFTSLREEVLNIVEALRQQEPVIRGCGFIGQGGSASGVSRASVPGLKQSEQKRILKDFRDGKYNVLICTCIGEEGLDIPEVDLIVCFDATASPTRAVQRHGRTGRHKDGKIIYILSSGKEEENYHSLQRNSIIIRTQLRNASNNFELARGVVNPRMLPRQHEPKRVDESFFAVLSRASGKENIGFFPVINPAIKNASKIYKQESQNATASEYASSCLKNFFRLESNEHEPKSPEPSDSSPFSINSPPCPLFSDSNKFLRQKGFKISIAPPPTDEMPSDTHGASKILNDSKLIDGNCIVLGNAMPQIHNKILKLVSGKLVNPIDVLDNEICDTANAWDLIAASVAAQEHEETFDKKDRLTRKKRGNNRISNNSKPAKKRETNGDLTKTAIVEATLDDKLCKDGIKQDQQYILPPTCSPGQKVEIQEMGGNIERPYKKSSSQKFGFESHLNNNTTQCKHPAFKSNTGTNDADDLSLSHRLSKVMENMVQQNTKASQIAMKYPNIQYFEKEPLRSDSDPREIIHPKNGNDVDDLPLLERMNALKSIEGTSMICKQNGESKKPDNVVKRSSKENGVIEENYKNSVSPEKGDEDARQQFWDYFDLVDDIPSNFDVDLDCSEFPETQSDCSKRKNSLENRECYANSQEVSLLSNAHQQMKENIEKPIEIEILSSGDEDSFPVIARKHTRRRNGQARCIIMDSPDMSQPRPEIKIGTTKTLPPHTNAMKKKRKACNHMAAQFLDVEAEISGESNDSGCVEHEDDGFESDFIDDEIIDTGVGPIHRHKFDKFTPSPSAFEVIRRIRQRRMGKFCSDAKAASRILHLSHTTPNSLHFEKHLSGGENQSDEYDRDDSFIADSDADEIECSWETPGGGSADSHDDHCGACGGNQGELLLCDGQGCKISMHVACARLHHVPVGDWYCPWCRRI